MSASSAPATDQVEITLLGPGFGESVVVHLGGGRWIVIDSCHDDLARRSAPLAYLTSLGVDPASQVDLVLATHWHDDHIKGLSELFEACKGAKFCCSAAFGQPQFQAMIDAYESGVTTRVGSGVKEINKIFGIVNTRPIPMKPAIADRSVLTLEPNVTGHGRRVRVTTLSPSDEQVNEFYAWVGYLLPGALNPSVRPVVDENHLSVATWIEFGEEAALLGADLEETGQPNSGWSAVVTSSNRPQGRASVFKIPHHGSQNGHHADVWTRMLMPNPFVLLCPFNRGKKIPKKSDITRISGLSPNGFATAGVEPRTKQKLSKTLQRAIREGNIKLSEIEPSLGIVRLRNRGASGFGQWDVDLLKGAHSLKDFVAVS